MASKDDRKTLSTLIGMPSMSSATASVIPRYDERWTKPAIAIDLPKSSPKAVGNTAVRNPYDELARPRPVKSTNRTNPTAGKTLLNRSITPRTPRHSLARIGPQKYSNTLGRDKGKATRIGRASETRPPPSHEIIDVDAEAPSTDDLDLLAPSSPSTSRYFEATKGPILRTNGRDGRIAGPSVIADGEYTKRLRAKHGDVSHSATHEIDQDLQQQKSSSIESFSEDEENQANFVKKLVAKYEQERKLASMRVVDFKNPNTFKKKDRMQPRHSNLKHFPITITNDNLSDSSWSRTPASGKSSPHRLPISAMFIGRQELHQYHIVELVNGKWLNFKGSLDLGPMNISSRNFSGFQYTNPLDLDDTIHPAIFYFQAAQTAQFGQWVANFASVFQPGDHAKGHIAIKFNTSDKQWNFERYQSTVQKVSNLLSAEIVCEALRPIASKNLWGSLESGAKFQSGDPTTLSDSIYGGAELVEDLNSQGPEGSLSIESSLRESRVDGIQKFRHSPPGSGAWTRKRPSGSTNKEENAGAEVTIVEPPPKRQRVEDYKPLRRTTRQQGQKEKSPNCDADEVILSYPYGTPGAVNVTAGDVGRLQPEEFLNDTLIEFGLKAWLKELEATDPDTASQVHVLNSFFYKKLNKRNIKEGYNSVRKWTSKIDIFSKKYIVVPINEHLHWYLAIIYEPEHILQKPPSPRTPHTNAVTRRQAKAREVYVSDDAIETKAEPPLEPQTEPQNISEVAQTQADVDQDMVDGTNSETEVEQLAFAASCSITTTCEHSSTVNTTSKAREALIKESVNRDKSLEVAPGSPMKIDHDHPLPDVAESTSRSGASDTTMGSRPQSPIEIPDSQPTLESIDTEVTPAKFYRKSYLSQSRKKGRVGEPVIIDDKPRTKIFILDSLGTKHPQAMKQLRKWLELEAMDKKKIESITPAIGKMALVPTQPNFCDCGLYVLHFTKVFMSHPRRFCHIIMTKERPNMEERRRDWEDASVKAMRDELRAKILAFSEDWRQQRAVRAEEKKKRPQQEEEEEEEDSDVAIVEHVKATGKKGKSTRTKT